MRDLGSSKLNQSAAAVACMILSVPTPVQTARFEELSGPQMPQEPQDPQKIPNSQERQGPQAYIPYEQALTRSHLYTKLNGEEDPAWFEKFRLDVHKGEGRLFPLVEKAPSRQLDYVVDHVVQAYARTNGTLTPTEGALVAGDAIRDIHRPEGIDKFADQVDWIGNVGTDLLVKNRRGRLGGNLVTDYIVDYLKDVKGELQDELEVQIRKSKREFVKEFNYKALEIIARKNPSLYDAIQDAIKVHQAAKLPLNGIDSFYQNEVVVNLPSRDQLGQQRLIPEESGPSFVVRGGSKKELSKEDRELYQKYLTEVEGLTKQF